MTTDAVGLSPHFEIKEWHFHIYFHQNNEESTVAALALREAVIKQVSLGNFKVVPLERVNYGPIGPHPAGSYELWVPAEHFAKAFSFITLNRGALTILVHPLSGKDYYDHSDGAVWFGPSFRIDLSGFDKNAPWPSEGRSQYPELGLGYAAQV